MKFEVSNPRPDITITLSWEQAEILRSILGRVGGSGTARNAVDELWDGLGSLGVKPSETFTIPNGMTVVDK